LQKLQLPIAGNR